MADEESDLAAQPEGIADGAAEAGDPLTEPVAAEAAGEATPAPEHESAVASEGSSDGSVGEEVAEEAARDLAADEAEIREELGIGGGKIEIDREAIDRLLSEAVVGYEQVFAGSNISAESGAGDGEATADGALGGGGDMVAKNLGLLRDVNMKVKVELGRGRMYLKDILRLAQGSVVELERLAGDPLDIYVNEKVIARGEVLVLNENFCIRITEIYDPAETLALAGS